MLRWSTVFSLKLTFVRNFSKCCLKVFVRFTFVASKKARNISDRRAGTNCAGSPSSGHAFRANKRRYWSFTASLSLLTARSVGVDASLSIFRTAEATAVAISTAVGAEVVWGVERGSVKDELMVVSSRVEYQ